ncbi:MAG: hypothetical protein RIQ47_1347 [Bacteroidota bacterium]|jgi:hypothetical protein
MDVEIASAGPTVGEGFIDDAKAILFFQLEEWSVFHSGLPVSKLRKFY